jgi:hypothetical protein
MEKTSKVTQVVGNGTFESQYGTLFKFEVSFENGDSGQYNSKVQNQNKFALGQEVTYTIDSRDHNGRTYYTIKPIQAIPQGNRGGGYVKDPETDKRITRMSVLKVAGDLVINGEVELHDLTKVAQILEQYVISGGDTMSDVYQQAQPKGKGKGKGIGNIEQNFIDESISNMEDGLPF